MTDLEGVAGVVNWHEYGAPEHRYHSRGKALTTLEVNAAIDGFMAAGADEFLVVDGHGHGAIDSLLLHRAAMLLTGRPLGYPFACDETFDAACQIGQHAKANADGGHLSHTGSFGVEDLRINGRSVGEMGCNMLFASYFEVPTILVTGDQAACDEALDLVPKIETVAVKEGLKRGSASGMTRDEALHYNCAAIHLHPEEARTRIRQGAELALRKLTEIEPFRIEPPYELVSVLRPEERGGPMREARVTSDDLLDLLRQPRRHEVPS